MVAQNSNGVNAILFDGFAEIPQADVTPDSQSVTFTAVGVAVRCWDSPIRGRLQRNADQPTYDSSTGPVDVDLVCRFNPSDTSAANGNKGGIQPNCTPDGCDVNEANDSDSYPVFLDENMDVPPGTSPAPITNWTISKSCRYIMSVANSTEKYVSNPDYTTLTSLLQAYAPPTGSNTSTLGGDQSADIVVRDYDASDKAWPIAIETLLGYAGFAFSFVTNAGLSGSPQTNINIYRNDALTTIAPKQLYLQPSGGTLGNAPNNVSSFHLARLQQHRQSILDREPAQTRRGLVHHCATL